MTLLFVGGVRDGARFDVPDDRQQWVVADRPKVLLSWPPPVTVEPTMVRQEAYTRMKFRGLKDIYSVFAGERLTPDDVLPLLLAHYKPPDSDRAYDLRLREVSLATVEAKLLGVGFLAIFPDGAFQYVASSRISLKPPE